jgi:hypothetical protein
MILLGSFSQALGLDRSTKSTRVLQPTLLWNYLHNQPPGDDKASFQVKGFTADKEFASKEATLSSLGLLLFFVPLRIQTDSLSIVERLSD